jgi:hypothetical protein
MTAVPEATGSVYAITRSGNFVEIELATGVRHTEALPSAGPIAADTLAVLPDGVVGFRRLANAAVAFPNERARQAVAVTDLQFLDVAHERVLAVAPGTAGGRGGQLSDVALLNGVGQTTARIAVSSPSGELVDRSYRSGFVAVDDYLVASDLRRWSLSTRAVVQLATGRLVIGALGKNLLVRSVPCDRACRWYVLTIDGDVIQSVADPFAGRTFATSPKGPEPYGLIDDTLSTVVYLYAPKVTEPGEIRAVDLATGTERTLVRADDLGAPTALTPDGGHVLVPSNLTRGEITIVPVSGAPSTVLDLGEPLLVVTAGASRT